MTDKEYLKLKIGQIIYSNCGASPLEIVEVPRIGINNDFVVKDIHNFTHIETTKYIKENFEIKPINIMNKEEAAHLSNILKAYSEGKKIERLNTSVVGAEWKNTSCLDLALYPVIQYRIKKENKYRPYKSAEEFLKAQKEHGPYIKISDDYYLPNMIITKGICGAGEIETWNKVIEKYKWQDGHPVGILEDE